MTQARRSLLTAVSVTLLVALPALANPVSMGPQAMEGNLKLHPGDLLMAGFDFTIPGSHPLTEVFFFEPSVTFQAQCVTGGGGGPIVVLMPSQSVLVPQNDGNWFPSGDQHSSSVYQGTVAVPDLCGGGLISLRDGGTFTVQLAAGDITHAVHVRWHYSANGTSGSWSGTGSFLPSAVTGG